jgi:hypothetical protein
MRSDLEFQRVYEFLSRLRPEFEPRCAQLIARGRVPLSVVLSKLHAEETCLRGASLLGVCIVLVARAPTVLAVVGCCSRALSFWLLFLMVWVAHHQVVGVAPLMVGVALTLLGFRVAIVRS